jgi:mevalonate pyrophosphate decarboxylase
MGFSPHERRHQDHEQQIEMRHDEFDPTKGAAMTRKYPTAALLSSSSASSTVVAASSR